MDENGIFTLVTNAAGKTKTVLKKTIVWYLNNNKTKLSSDRLHRVRAKDYERGAGKDSTFVNLLKIRKIFQIFRFRM